MIATMFFQGDGAACIVCIIKLISERVLWLYPVIFQFGGLITRDVPNISAIRDA